MNGRYYAHTPPDFDPDHWQSMRTHTENVAELAVQFATPFQAEDLARWSAWLHDVGKYSPEFQQYLRDCDAAKKQNRKPPKAGSAEHKCAGALLALKLFRAETAIKQIVAICALGHHGGLNAAGDTHNKIDQTAAKQDLNAAIETARRDFTELNSALPTASSILALAKLPPDRDDRVLGLEMLLRFVFSCLVDADSLDTEAHFSPEKALIRERSHKTLQTDALAATWLATLQANQQKLQERAEDTPVNQVRRTVYEACLDAAEDPPGVFSLTVPTGGGKTRSSLAFALAHAAAHGHNRIIYAIPYTSIIDQTVDVFRTILGDDAVLEHHSAIEVRTEDNSESETEAQNERAKEQQRRLAAENWDVPLIVTTTVQLFESLFSNRTSRCRKLHNIANSVLILDEVQTLPAKLLSPLLSGLRALAAQFHVSIVLCTATQPAIEGESPYLRGFPKVTPIIANPKPHFEALKRVKYRVEREAWSWSRVAEEMRKKNVSSLAVLNTKKDALELLRMLEGTNVQHLSTLLCSTHRKQVLAEVKAALEAERKHNGPPVLLVSTQVIEAGVDIDFPYAFRAKGPLDRIVQAAGRCNREGLQDWEESEVVVFTPEEGSAPPGEYKTAMEQAWLMIAGEEEFDFDSPEAVTKYFTLLYRLFNKHGLDKNKVQETRSKLDYPNVAHKVRLIDDDTIPVLVNYDHAQFDALVAEITHMTQRGFGMTRDLWRRVQPFTVALYRHERKARSSLIEELVPDQFYVWHGTYDAVVGIGDQVNRDPADLIA